jgi:predicted ATPase
MLLLRDATDRAAAEEQFQQARRMAREQGARSLELRASVSLGRLLGAGGRRDEARALVGAIFGWFTEGQRTADLAEAGALLAELS